jgi:hypothetical protein
MAPEIALEQLIGFAKRNSDDAWLNSNTHTAEVFTAIAESLSTITALQSSLTRVEGEKARLLAALRKVPLFGMTEDALGWRCAGCGAVSGIREDGSNREEACAPWCHVPIVEAAIDAAEGKR